MRFILLLLFISGCTPTVTPPAPDLAASGQGGGTDVGNGGDAVVCRNPDNSIRSAELLDYYEGRATRGFQIKLDPEKTVDQLMETFWQRMSQHETYLVNQLKSDYEFFAKESAFVSQVTLVNIKDSKHLFYPAGCQVEQVAIQRQPRFQGEAYFTINKDIWDKMNPANRAGLILHEILYRLVLRSALNFGNEGSSYVRHFTALVAADEVKNMSYKAYISYLKDYLYMRFTNVEGNTVLLSDMGFDKDGQLAAYTIFFVENEPFKLAPDLDLPIYQSTYIRYQIKEKSIEISATIRGGRFQYRGRSFFLGYSENVVFELNKKTLQLLKLSRVGGSIGYEELQPNGNTQKRGCTEIVFESSDVESMKCVDETDPPAEP